MSVLSNVDVEREILKGNIRISPYDNENVKGSTYNFKASEYAWSINTKEDLVKDNIIVIPPNDSALIATKEVIWVSKKICGTYHSKVSIVTQGGGHIGTTLDSEWSGHSLITVHNHHKKDYLKIPVNETFVSIMFHYLNRKTTFEQDNNSSQSDWLKEYIPQCKDPVMATAYFDESWKKQPKEIKKKMLDDPQYIELDKRKSNLRSTLKSISFIFLALFLLSVVTWLKYKQSDYENFTEFFIDSFFEVGLSGIIVAILVGLYKIVVR